MKSNAALPRRTFLKSIGAGALLSATTVASAGTLIAAKPHHRAPALSAVGDRVDPWIEIVPGAFGQNMAAISAKAGGKRVIAVLKCNAYGMDPSVVAPILDTAPQVWGYAVAKAEEAFAVRDAGSVKPIVMLADFSGSEAEELVRRDVALCTCSEATGPRLVTLAKKLGRAIPIHVKIDAGLGRLGVQDRFAPGWVAELINSGAVKVKGIFCNLIETDQASAHLERFKVVVAALRSKNFEVGPAHAAASWALTHVKGCELDLVRPGLMTYGVYPEETTTDFIDLHTVHRLRGRVIRVAQLRPGDTVGYGQDFIAKESTWVATVMCGWSDGYNFKSNAGCNVAISGKLYPLVGRTANNTIVNLGLERTVSEGEIATLVGPEAGVRPNELADKSEISGYNQVRYNAKLPKFLAL